MTRREETPLDRVAVFHTLPVFRWLRCVACGKRFRREFGWRAVTGPRHGGKGRSRHGCRTCFPERADFARYVDQGRCFKPRTRPATPPPAAPPAGGGARP